MLSLCELCGLGFSSRAELECHKKVDHNLSSKVIVPFKCQFKDCTKIFKNQSLLNKHSVIHSEKKYFCKECNKAFKRKYDADNHHNKVLKFPCSVCQLVFKTKYHRNRHETTTSCCKLKDRKLKCKLCNKFYARNDYLTIHMQKAHKNNV